MDCCTPRTDNHGTTGFPTEDEHRKTGQRTTAAARCNGRYSSRSTDDMTSPLSGNILDICFVAVQGRKKKSIRPDRYQMPWPAKTGRLSRKPHTPTTTGVYSTSQYECSAPTWWLHQKAQTNQGATLPRGWIEGEGPAGPAWHQDIEMIPEIQGRSTPESQPSPALWCMTVSEQRRILSMIRDPAADQISDGELHTVSCLLSILAHACDTFLLGGSFTAHPEQAPTQLGIPDQQRCKSYLAYSYSLADNVSMPITP
ncbi:hypothetical protein EDB80DRAFT_335919 [Ilyonectria destructans]|nr:hypothetical protein EDB80DRAFT_335919 [Ilyonectria destructans]